MFRETSSHTLSKKKKNQKKIGYVRKPICNLFKIDTVVWARTSNIVPWSSRTKKKKKPIEIQHTIMKRTESSKKKKIINSIKSITDR